MTFGEVFGVVLGAAVVYLAVRYAYRTLRAKYGAPGTTGAGSGGGSSSPDKKDKV